MSRSANLLDWKRGFGLYFWYGMDQAAQQEAHSNAQNLPTALGLYQNAFNRYANWLTPD